MYENLHLSKYWLIAPLFLGITLLTNVVTAFPEPFIHTAYAQELTIPEPLPILETAHLQLDKNIKGYNPLAYNCFAFVASRTKVPRMRDILPNTTIHTGAVAIMYYPVKDVAIVTHLGEESFTVLGSNVPAGTIREREIRYDDPRLAGFFEP